MEVIQLILYYAIAGVHSDIQCLPVKIFCRIVKVICVIPFKPLGSLWQSFGRIARNIVLYVFSLLKIQTYSSGGKNREKRERITKFCY